MRFPKSSTAIRFCKICFKPIRDNSLRFLLGDSPPLCRKCFESMKPKLQRWKVGNVVCYALFEYRDQIRSLLYQFKGCFDYELFPVFVYFSQPLIRFRFRNYIIVPAPSSALRNAQRGFNQVVEMFKPIGLEISDVLLKNSDDKQSDLGAAARKQVYKVLAVKKGASIQGKKILLVDDVYTTGSTVKGCVDLLKKHGASKVAVLVMSRTPKHGV